MKLGLVKLVTISFILCSCSNKDTFVLSFGSCNNQLINNTLWAPIASHHPDLFIWGGDIIYSDTEDMEFMKKNYRILFEDSSYVAFKNQVPVTGTWDDHDYGLNDGGVHYQKKDSAQQIFLDFFEVANNDPRRERKGVYHLKTHKVDGAAINFIILDTRYFRSDLKKDPTGEKRYIPNNNKKTTMLGDVQWKWLENTLNNSKAQFNVIVSSIQFLSYEHGYESWGTMPLEVEKMKRIITDSKAKGVLFLSGDRHIAEISGTRIEGLDYPLIDFTSSGMTHSFSSFSGEPNVYRISEVVAEKNFGLLFFNFKENTVKMQIRGENDLLLEEVIQKY